MPSTRQWASAPLTLKPAFHNINESPKSDTGAPCPIIARSNVATVAKSAARNNTQATTTAQKVKAHASKR